jgi:hypothetical protein
MSSTTQPIKRSTNDNYKRPKITAQDKLTPKQIKELLENYVEIDDIKDVALDTHIRYFTKDKGKKKFRTGGFLLNKAKSDKYIILTNRKISWSVDTKNSILFKALSAKELTEIHQVEISELKDVLKKLYKESKELKKENKELKDKLKKK